MDLRWIDDVLTLLEEGNLTRAAERRNVTQPAFSRRIRAFEHWLGAVIIERQTNRIETSDALKASEPEIRAIASQLRELRTKVAQYEPMRTTVSLAAQHAPIQSVFPDLALRARETFPKVSFRLRAGNLSDCVSHFLRGDVSLLLCYEAEKTQPMAFGDHVRRGLCGAEVLVPVVGGALRFAVKDNGSVPSDTPAIAYPPDSFFGEVLRTADRPFATADMSENTACLTAFSSGILEMAAKGYGVGWVPFSMAYRELEAGNLISLANRLGQVQLDVVLYADVKSDTAAALLNFWTRYATAARLPDQIFGTVSPARAGFYDA
ncbi:LysR family transcriptional regulator [Tateyamaria omphalii]|uniref:LysR family transcriptional regulator n=1 Tax=Tateyamaria omphalii TaxID=299262 RepID=UPI001676EC4E|nr:LysR family transcriptional regulator [Tateyamaria omphalii]GGX60601.1 LysR family transcriptional regulator [Tateyamaria omphalii]